MSLSSSPADKLSTPLVLASPDRVVFRTLPHPLASNNKRVTLSLRRTSTPQAGQRHFASEPGMTPPNTQSPNTSSHHTGPHSLSSLPSNRVRPSCTTVATTTSPLSPMPLPASAEKPTLPQEDKFPKISTTLVPTAPHRQTVPVLKNGLPLKSALKSQATSSSPNPLSSHRPSIRSHMSPELVSSKFVHFNAQLEHVRLFLQGETPSCVSDRDTIIDAGDSDASTSDIKLTLINWAPVSKGEFQPGDIDAGAPPLRVENVELSDDQTEIQGTILIQNIAFHKHVSVRYTEDFWQTQTEVSAEFVESISGSELDRFAFKLPLDMEKSMVEKTFCFAVRYQVIGREFWDSNNDMNYRVECKRVVVNPPAASELSKQMSSLLLASRIPDYSKPVLKKKSGNRYDLSSSLSAAYSQPITIPSRPLSTRSEALPISQTAYRPSEYITPIQSPPGYHHSLYASSPKFMDSSFLSAASPPEHFHIGFEPSVSKKNARHPWQACEIESGFYGPYSSSAAKTAPISIPTTRDDPHRPLVGSSSYVDLVDRYCFYESGSHSSPYSSYPNSPPAPCIRG